MSEDVVTAGFVMDREMQRHLLEEMRSVYPSAYFDHEVDLKRIIPQIAYLDGHGLCEGGIGATSGGHYWNGSTITAAGLDFLEQDGGLTAILGVVNVKLHAETIRDLLAAKIDATDLPPEKRSILKEHLKKLPGTALQAATGDLVKIGLDHLPDATQWLHTIAGLV